MDFKKQNKQTRNTKITNSKYAQFLSFYKLFSTNCYRNKKSREVSFRITIKYTSEVPQNGFKKKPVLNRT